MKPLSWKPYFSTPSMEISWSARLSSAYSTLFFHAIRTSLLIITALVSIPFRSSFDGIYALAKPHNYTFHILLINCQGQSHKTVSTDHNFWRESRIEADSNRGPSAYQPNTLPLGQTGSHGAREYEQGLNTSLISSVWPLSLTVAFKLRLFKCQLIPRDWDSGLDQTPRRLGRERVGIYPYNTEYRIFIVYE